MNTRTQAVKWSTVATVVSLAACGGGGPDSPATAGATTPPSVTGSSTGVLSDALVQGVAYSTTSGVKGTTNAQGQYRFNPGDTVSFTLGTLSLGSVPAAAMVTPIELAAGSNDKLQNLLVLLQSLDADGVAGNGITIPTAAATATTSAINLSGAPATFASSANAGLVAAQAAGGISRPPTSSSAATAHFVSQFEAQLSSQVWLGSYDNGAGVIFQRFGAGGEYLNAQIGPAEEGGSSGVEYGTVRLTSVDARGFAPAVTVALDTNGSWGLSKLSACQRVRVEGGELAISDAPASCVTESTFRMSKAPNDATGIVGVWAAGSASVVKTQHLVFWADGRFIMVDPEGDTVNQCGGPGVERGTYEYNATTRAFRVLTVTVDTNGCAGLRDTAFNNRLASFQLTFSANGNTANAAAGNESFDIYRISR